MFKEQVNNLVETIYKANNLLATSLEEESQNAKYGGGKFTLSSKTVRFRVAKTTPTKSGQFVAFWEKDKNNKNRAFHYNQAPELLVINCIGDNREFGQFIFPKEILLKRNILRNDTSKGKMGIRLYPAWSLPESEEALKTQAWQSEYYIDLTNTNTISKNKLLRLYLQNDRREMMTKKEEKQELNLFKKSELNVFEKHELVNPVDYENTQNLERELIKEEEGKK